MGLVWDPRASYFTAPSLSLLIWKMGAVRCASKPLGLLCGLNETLYTKPTAKRRHMIVVVTTVNSATENVIGGLLHHRAALRPKEIIPIHLSLTQRQCHSSKTASHLRHAVPPGSVLRFSRDRATPSFTERLLHTPAVPALLSGAAPTPHPAVSSCLPPATSPHAPTTMSTSHPCRLTPPWNTPTLPSPTRKPEQVP